MTDRVPVAAFRAEWEREWKQHVPSQAARLVERLLVALEAPAEDERLASWMTLQDALPAAHPIHVASGWRTMMQAVVQEDTRLRAALEHERALVPEDCIYCHHIPDPPFSSRNPALIICRECLGRLPMAPSNPGDDE